MDGQTYGRADGHLTPTLLGRSRPNKKLGYRRGTERHAMLVNSCYISRGIGVRFQTAKVTFKVIPGHWQWCHLISHTRFPISLPLQLCLCLAQLTRYYHLFHLLSFDSEHIPLGGNISRMH